MSGFYASGTSTYDTWQTWVTQTQIATTNYIWQQWAFERTAQPNVITYIPPPAYVESEIYWWRLWISNLWRGIAYAAHAAMEKLASDAATTLLLSNLDKDQKAAFKKDKQFAVKGQRSGKLYLVRRGTTVLCQGDRNTYCIHPKEAVPPEDAMLAQKLMIEADEEEFLKTANRSAY